MSADVIVLQGATASPGMAQIQILKYQHEKGYHQAASNHWGPHTDWCHLIQCYHHLRALLLIPGHSLIHKDPLLIPVHSLIHKDPLLIPVHLLINTKEISCHIEPRNFTQTMHSRVWFNTVQHVTILQWLWYNIDQTLNSQKVPIACPWDVLPMRTSYVLPMRTSYGLPMRTSYGVSILSILGATQPCYTTIT